MSLLCEREDFPDLVAEAAEFHGIPNPAIVEKDYYVTEALRLIARDFGDVVLFKGGTSLSKGWKLIRRFSEDIDLYIDRGERGASATDTLLKHLAACVSQHPALISYETTQRIGGVARAFRFTYVSRLGGTALPPTVLLEAGIQSGTYPSETRDIRSLLAEFLIERQVELDTGELAPFSLRVLHFRRTFVEKLFALHHKVERGLLEERQPLGSYARHYYDLSQLLGQQEVQVMLRSSEYADIARDYHTLTTRYFPRQLLPPGMNLAMSQALFPSETLAQELAAEYQRQCQLLCYGEYPSFAAVLAALEGIREFLVAVAVPVAPVEEEASQ
jgi:nucleotidyltransferase AbiEii toxin of type IV toxin-antitoxin system